MRKLVLSIVILLVLVGAGVAGWILWNASERLARLDGWKQQFQEALKQQDEAKRNELITTLRAEIQKDPERADTRLLLGRILASSGKMSDAAVELREAARIEPGNVEIRRVLAQVCLRIDLVNEAAKNLEEALGHASDAERPGVELDLARVFMERYRGSAKDEDFRSARNYFQDARRHPETEAEAMDGYAMLFLMKGSNFDFEKGIATYRELLAKYPVCARADKIRELLDNFDKQDAAAPPPDPKTQGKSGDG